jgi:hypothetical protein
MVSRLLKTNQCEINEYSRKDRIRRGLRVDNKNKEANERMIMNMEEKK